jgi:hypothetical protein
MSKKDEATGEIIEVSPRPAMAYVADKAQPAVSLTKVLQEMGLSGPRVPADQLVDTTFTILRAKPFQSSFSEDAHAWFCVCQAKDDGEVFTTVLGGQAVVDILDALVATGMTNPLEVTLRQVSGGRFGRYYVLE